MNQISHGDRVEVSPERNDTFDNFTGTVIETRNGKVFVRDQDDDVFEVEPRQCELVKE